MLPQKLPIHAAESLCYFFSVDVDVVVVVIVDAAHVAAFPVAVVATVIDATAGATNVVVAYVDVAAANMVAASADGDDGAVVTVVAKAG